MPRLTPPLCVFGITATILSSGCTSRTQVFEGHGDERVWTAMVAAARTPEYDDWKISDNEVFVDDESRRIEVYRVLRRTLVTPYSDPRREREEWRFRIDLGEQGPAASPEVTFTARQIAIPAHAWDEADRFFNQVRLLLGPVVGLEAATGSGTGSEAGSEAGSTAGAVDIFTRGPQGAPAWRPSARISPRSPEPGASFGAATAFDRAGSARIAVGSPRHDAVGAFDAGRVHVFRCAPSPLGADGRTRWTEVASIAPPTPRMSMWFGAAVAMEADLLAVGSPGDDVVPAHGADAVQGAGDVYLYRRIGVTSTAAHERYRLERVLTAPDPAHAAWFGLSIDLEGGVLAVGEIRARRADEEQSAAQCDRLPEARRLRRIGIGPRGRIDALRRGRWVEQVEEMHAA